MKKILCLLVLCCACAASAKELPVSKEGQEEAALYMDFMRAVRAELLEDPKACGYYQDALARAPQSKYLRRILTLCAVSEGDMAQADRYASYIEDGENDGEDLAVYAFYKWRKGELGPAQTYYEQALEKAPDDMRILYQYVLLLVYIDPDRAAEKLQEHKANYPSISQAIDYEIGNIYRRKGQPLKALEYYNSATQADPEYAEPYLARAEMYEKAAQYFLMLHELEALEKTGYESAPMYSRMGSVYVIVKDDARARAYFQKAKKLDNGDVPAGYFLALYAEQDGDYAAAARYLRETADFNEDAGKWVQMAFYEQRAGDMARALDTLKEAYERFDKNVEIGYFYALALQDDGQYRRAARILKGVLHTNPDYEQARLAYAFALESLHKYKDMEEQLRLVLEQNPNNAAAYNLLGYSLAERNKRLDEAERLVSRALSLSPGDRAFADSLAWVYYRKGEYQKALDLLEGLDKDFIEANADVAYHLGAVYAALGQPQQALPYLQQAAPEVKEAQKLLKRLSKEQR